MIFLSEEFEDTVEVFIGELVVHGEAEDGVGYAVGNGQVLFGGGGEAAVGGELADEGIEVAAGEDPLGFHLFVELVAGLAEFLSVDEDGEVGVVVAHAGHVVEEGDAGHGPQGLAVADGHLVALGDGCVHLAEGEQAVGGAHFVHLGVDAGGHDGDLAGEAEVFEVVDAAFGLLVVDDHGAAFDGVVDFGGVEGEGGDVAGVEDGLTVDLDAEGVGGVVDDLEAVFVGHFLDAADVARLAVAVDGHDGGGLGGDGGFDAPGVEPAVGGVDVYEDGLDAVPPQGVGGGDEAVGGGDDFSGNAEGLEGGDEREGAVGEEGEVGHFEVGGELLLEPAVELAVVGDPFAFPDLFEQLVELVEVGEQGGGDGDGLHFLQILLQISDVKYQISNIRCQISNIKY